MRTPEKKKIKPAKTLKKKTLSKIRQKATAAGYSKKKISSRQKITMNKQVAETLRKRTEKIVNNQIVLLKLAKSDSPDLNSALRKITATDAKTLGVERVSVWFFNEDRSEITCKDLYRLSKNLHENGLTLQAKNYPGYFKSLNESSIISANDDCTDLRTNEFTDEYLKPFGITSMMDVPVWLHGKVVGIVCHEHTGPPREWTPEEQDFATSIADMVSLSLEASRRKEAEERAVRFEQEWERVFNAITDMITIHDNDFNIIRANKSAKKILGLPSLDGADVKCFKYYHGKNSPPENCPSCVCLKTKKSAVSEVFEPHLNKFVEIRAMPKLDGDNRLIGLIHIVRDITKRKKIDEEHGKLLDAVVKAKIEWEMAFDNAMELIILLDKELNIVRCNKSFAYFIGVPVNEIVGNKFFEYFFSLDPEQTEECRRLILKEEPIMREEVQTNTGHWYYVSSHPVKDAKGEFLRTVIIATDIKELKNVQQKLGQSEKELKKRVNELEKFYNMAIGREMKMKELKTKIKELQFKLLQHRD